MLPYTYMKNVLIGTAAVVLSGGYFIWSAQTQTPFTLASASVASATLANPRPAATRTKSASSAAAAGGVSLAIAADVKAAVDAFASVATSLSRPEALSDAFRGYFAFKAAHADEVKKPYLYFVDYGLPSTAARGYVFDMSTLKLVEGPFTVAHGKGSSTSQYGVPTKFSNASHSNATSLGLYVTKSTYAFTGHPRGNSTTRSVCRSTACRRASTTTRLRAGSWCTARRT